MKTKTLALAIVAITLSGCMVLNPTPSATATITNWEQLAIAGTYTFAWVYFDVTNTGTIQISSYSMWIEGACADGSTCQVGYTGAYLTPGATNSDVIALQTAGKELTSVEVSEVEIIGD